MLTPPKIAMGTSVAASSSAIKLASPAEVKKVLTIAALAISAPEPPKIDMGTSVAASPVAPKFVAPAVKYTANGIPYRVSDNDGKTFALFSVPFARFDCTTGICDRYVGMQMFDSPPATEPTDLPTLMLDCMSLLRHGKEWAARPMFGPNGFYYGRTPLEAAQKAVAACKK